MGQHRFLLNRCWPIKFAELSAAFGQSIEKGATLEDIAGTIYAHSTLGEAIQEAAMRALGHALHI